MKNFLKKLSLILAIVMAITICFAFVGCGEENCYYNGCDNPIASNSLMYCDIHSCKAEDCHIGRVDIGEKYCDRHSCDKYGCKNPRIVIKRTVSDDGELTIDYSDYCLSHTCCYDGCYKEGNTEWDGKNYCYEHWEEEMRKLYPFLYQ